MSDFMKSYERYNQSVAAANAHNKILVFDALTAAGITGVTVFFDGEGDSGQIESIKAFAGDKPVDVPQTAIQIQGATWGREDLSVAEATLSDAIESLCYGYLEQENGGWENDAGAYGEFTFTVAERSIVLDFNARYTDIHNSIYSL